jgi:hypothetical protein
LVTPPILAAYTTDLPGSCDQTTETDVVLNAPIADLHSYMNMCASNYILAYEHKHIVEGCVNDIPTIFSAPNAEVTPAINMSAQTKILAADNDPCDLIVDSRLDHIKLVMSNEALAMSSHTNSLFSVLMDPPISLSNARDKIDEIPCLKSVYSLDFTFHLVGEYDIDNVFMVHRICIMCDGSASSK